MENNEDKPPSSCGDDYILSLPLMKIKYLILKPKNMGIFKLFRS